MGWVLKVDDDFSLRESDLTIADAERLEKETDTTWRFISPLRSAAHAKAILKLGLEKGGRSIEAAHAEAEAMKVDDYLSRIGEEKDDMPAVFTDGFPPAADGTSTPS